MTVQEATNAFTQSARDFSTVALRLSDIKNGLQFFSEEPTEPEVTEPTDPEVTEPEKTEPKMYTEEELQAKVNKAAANIRKQEQSKAAKEARQKGMSENDKLLDELREHKARLEDAEKRAKRSELKDTTIGHLTKLNYGAGFAEFVMGDDEEGLEERVGKFNTEMEKEIQRRVKAALGSKTPEKAKEPQKVETDKITEAFDRGLR
ncbi:TPA: capsid assembly scaffolding protein Gp46 family protein [Bacillus anthracis]|nr:DUF4355 domain-containing protein [Bacillus cereus biovar anthracis]HDR6230968.1 DUF4355 domain-containing protein [Bacillus cereus biovar anthracis]HDR6240495.1 DUF4355 domain-containing protein [Bacillus cereus biovar anthracis]HDR6252439.1 DUF4355 domain-containing protein [Bacillus cereus biovar anthracis]